MKSSLRHVLLALAASAPLAVLTGCAGYYSAPVVPPGGWAYSNISAPIGTDPDTNPVGSKVGTATSTSILGLVAMGDCSVNAAAQAGGLKNVNHVDYEFTNILGVYSTFTVRAHGE